MQTHDPQAALIESARRLRSRIVVQRSCDDFAVDERTPASVRCKPATATRLPNVRAMPRRAPATAMCRNWPRGWKTISNLCDGARRCARKLAELTYRQNREGGRCR